MTTVNLPADKFDTAMSFVKPDDAPLRAPLDKLAVLPGFNTRVKDADYNERVATIAESIATHGFFDDKPFAVTMLPGDDTIYIYDGEHRFDAAKQATLDGAEFPDGLPVAWAKDGATVKDLTIHLAHGNNGERLNMVELASVVRRMQGLEMTKEEIAAALGRTARHVDNLFVLAKANQSVKKAVASGQIAGAEAVKLLRKDPATAGAKIAEAVKKAEERGKSKATPKTMAAGDGPVEPKRKTTTAQMSISFPAGSKMGDNLKSLAGMIREALDINADGDVLNDEGVLIRFSVTKVDKAAEAAAATAAAEKAAAAEKRQQEREAAAAKKAEEKAAKAAEAEAKKKATAEALKTAAKGAAKAAGDKGAAKAKATAAPKKTAAEAKAAAQAHLSGGKADGETKTRRRAGKPAEADSKAEATSGAPEAESTPSGPETGVPVDLSDEATGGL